MEICIYGASSSNLEQSYYDAARELGGEIASRGHGLVFGGGRHGLMGACAEGAAARGGRILGIAPKFFDEPGILFPGCSEFIYTDTMRERKQLMEDRSDAVVVLPGGIGTYEEFFEMLTLRQLGQSAKAIAVLNVNGYFEPMEALLRLTAEKKFMSERCLSLYATVSSPAGALDYIESYVPRIGNVFRMEDYDK
jgi:uncharacterized protein (TIGR00730 family)